MKALAVGKQGELEFIDAKPPTSSPGYAMVDVRAFSINRGEYHRILQASPGWRPGWDFSGVVTQSRDSAFQPGQRVFGMLTGRSWATCIAAPVNHLASVPSNVSHELAAAIPVAGVTALRMIERLDRPLSGLSSLVTGAAGGVGRILIQLLSGHGAEVTAVVRDDSRGKGLQHLGARRVITMGQAGGRYDVIFDSIGGVALSTWVSRVVAPGGTVVTFGNSSHSRTDFNVSDFYPRQAQILGYHLLRDVDIRPPADDLSRLASMVADGQLDPCVDLVLPWTEHKAALKALASRAVGGKCVLRIPATDGGH